MEEWKECLESVRNKYFVSNKGRMKAVSKHTKKELIMKERLNNAGYFHVNISKKDYKIHVLVALHFIGPRPEEKVIDHINRIKTDNRVENLRYCSQLENARNTHIFRTDILEEDPNERRKVRLRLNYHNSKSLK